MYTTYSNIIVLFIQIEIVSLKKYLYPLYIKSSATYLRGCLYRLAMISRALRVLFRAEILISFYCSDRKSVFSFISARKKREKSSMFDIRHIASLSIMANFYLQGLSILYCRE